MVNFVLHPLDLLLANLCDLGLGPELLFEILLVDAFFKELLLKSSDSLNLVSLIESRCEEVDLSCVRAHLLLSVQQLPLQGFHFGLGHLGLFKGPDFEFFQRQSQLLIQRFKALS